MSNKIPMQAEQVAYRVVEDSAVLVSPEDSQLYWLNPVASRVWELADGQNTVEDIAVLLCQDYEVDRETALRDTEEMVAAFTAKQLFSPPQ